MTRTRAARSSTAILSRTHCGDFRRQSNILRALRRGFLDLSPPRGCSAYVSGSRVHLVATRRQDVRWHTRVALERSQPSAADSADSSEISTLARHIRGSAINRRGGAAPSELL